MRLKRSIGIIPGLAILVLPALASAHVIVTPSKAGVGQVLTFNVSVPDERDMDVTSIKLAVPRGVDEVVPTVKSGWSIQATTNSDKSDPEITSITWSGNVIPVGEREDFSFSAQVPDNPTTLDWKAYQTYADGTVVHWDQVPNGKSDDSIGNAGPYSVTRVVNDLNASTSKTSSPSDNSTVLIVSLLAIVISIVAFLRKP